MHRVEAHAARDCWHWLSAIGCLRPFGSGSSGVKGRNPSERSSAFVVGMGRLFCGTGSGVLYALCYRAEREVVCLEHGALGWANGYGICWPAAL